MTQLAPDSPLSPALMIEDAVDALWRRGARRLDRAGFAADAILVDASAGAMTLRSFGDLRDRVGRDLPDHRVHVQDGLRATLGCGGALRTIAQARHGTDGPFGPASHRPVAYRMALELQGEAEITDIWQVRDHGALLRSLSLSPRDWAKEHPGKPVTRAEPAAAAPRDPWAASLCDLMQTMMDGDFSVLHRSYDPAVELWLPGGVVQTGPARADRFWLSLRSALPTADFTIASAMGQEDPLSAPRAAIRWYLSGLHEGWGAFGAPTGAPVCVMGITQVEFGTRGLRREWTTYDELAVWQQITRAAR